MGGGESGIATIDDNLETYDGENCSSHVNVFSITNATEHERIFNDPLLADEGNESGSELEDEVIRPTDNVFVACSCEDDECTLEVYLYDQDNAAMYVHHDLKLNAYPAWIGYPWELEKTIVPSASSITILMCGIWTC